MLKEVFKDWWLTWMFISIQLICFLFMMFNGSGMICIVPMLFVILLIWDNLKRLKTMKYIREVFEDIRRREDAR